MDFLNRASSQVSDLFRSMTPGSRITAALLLIVVVVSLGYLFSVQVSGSDSLLFNGAQFKPSEIYAMEIAFGKAGLSSYEVNGARIHIPRSQKAVYLKALSDADALPVSVGVRGENPLGNASPFESHWVKTERLKAAKAKELAELIEASGDVEWAKVIYDTQTKSRLTGEKTTTASVTVKPVGSGRLDEARVSLIKHQVASAYAGLTPEGVTVTDPNGRSYPGESTSGEGILVRYAEIKLNFEKQWREKILAALAYVPNATVTTNVVLDRVRSSTERVRKIDPKPVNVQEKDESNSSSSTGSNPAGPPGIRRSLATVNQAQSLASSQNAARTEQERSNREVLSVVSGSETEKQSVGLTPTRVTVSIGIPGSYFENIWRKGHPAEEGQEPATPSKAELDQLRTEETAKIRKHVATLLPTEGVEDPLELVDVSVFADLPAVEPPEPGMAANTIFWLGQYWRTLAVAGLALFSLVVLRSMVRTTSAPPERRQGPDILPAEAEPADVEAAARTSRLERFSGSGPSLRDELSGLVQEDPDTAANVLKTWIGSAG